MISILKKIIQTLFKEGRNRGVYLTLLMNIAHLVGVLRGCFYKIIYFRNINSSIFSLQRNSTIEIFNKNSRISIGKFVFIRKNVSIRMDFDGVLSIGEKTFINDNCNINCINKITIGRGTKIAPYVCINDHDHNYKGLPGDHMIKGEVIIGENVWIGSHVVILKDTIIGDNVVVAAGSVVKGEIPSNTLFVNKRDNTLIHYMGTSS